MSNFDQIVSAPFGTIKTDMGECCALIETAIGILRIHADSSAMPIRRLRCCGFGHGGVGIISIIVIGIVVLLVTGRL